MAASGIATLIVSVDVEFPDVTWNAEFAELERSALELLERLNQYATPATWGLTDLAHPLGDEIVRQASHELAIHAGPSLIGSHLPRAKYLEQMQRRLALARQAGHVPTTLNLAAGCRVGHLDTLARFGITALRAPLPHEQTQSFWQQLRAVGRRSPTEPRPQMARWGVWQFSCEQVLPGLGLAQGRRSIDRAVQTQGVVHLAVELRALARDRRSSVALLDALLRHAAQRRAAGTLQMLTIDQCVTRFTRQHLGRPAQSILRKSA